MSENKKHHQNRQVSFQDLRQADRTLTRPQLHRAVAALMAEADLASQRCLHERAQAQYRAAAQLADQSAIDGCLLKEAIMAHATRIVEQGVDLLLAQPEVLAELADLSKIMQALQSKTTPSSTRKGLSA